MATQTQTYNSQTSKAVVYVSKGKNGYHFMYSTDGVDCHQATTSGGSVHGDSFSLHVTMPPYDWQGRGKARWVSRGSTQLGKIATPESLRFLQVEGLGQFELAA